MMRIDHGRPDIRSAWISFENGRPGLGFGRHSVFLAPTLPMEPIFDVPTGSAGSLRLRDPADPVETSKIGFADRGVENWLRVQSRCQEKWKIAQIRVRSALFQAMCRLIEFRVCCGRPPTTDIT